MSYTTARLILVMIVVGGCSSSSPGGSDDASTGADLDVADTNDGSVERSEDAAATADAGRPAYCNPLTTDHCLLPWPSSFYLTRDTTTKTGYRLSYLAEAMPHNKKGKPIDPTPYRNLDGFSIGSQPIIYFEEGFSPDIAVAPEKSTSDESSLWLIEWDSGEKVPYFSELDANAKDDYVPSLLVRPLAPLKTNQRYVIVIRKGAKNAAGEPLSVPGPFRKIRDAEELSGDPVLAAEGKRLEPVLTYLIEKQQLDRDQILLAWDFHTASDEAITGNLVRMVDEALSKLPEQGPSYELTEVIEHPVEQDANLWYEIKGNMEVPSYLASEDRDAWLNRDADGKPQYRALQKFPFQVQIPRCAETATEPLPIVIYGHGLFGGAADGMMVGQRRELFNRLCMVAAGADWIGFSENDKMAAASQITTDFSNIPRITDPLHQAHVNNQVLVELVLGKLLEDPALQINGKPVSDGKEIYYVGMSLGGIQGMAFAALSKRIERFVLHVGGGWWTQMMQRASGFAEFAGLIRLQYPDPLDVVIAIHLSQSLFDSADPIAYARHAIDEPFAGRQPKRILYQEALNDEQVPNIATRAVIRALGIPLLAPAVESVLGIEEKSGPLPSAYVQWNTSPEVELPTSNRPAPKFDTDDSPHEQVRRTESCNVQMEKFLAPTGLVEHTCGDTCCGKD